MGDGVWSGALVCGIATLARLVLAHIVYVVDDDPFEGILTLADAAALLGLSATTLRMQVRTGKLRAQLFGKTWLTTRAEVARYREQSLGQPGRRPTLYKWSDIKRRQGAE